LWFYFTKCEFLGINYNKVSCVTTEVTTLVDPHTHQLKLIRVTSSEYLGTHGVLIDDGVPFALTLEPPWRDNQPFESCIPTGVYVCKFFISPRFGPVYEITGVPDRSQILFHKGNFTKDTSGCVLVGEQFESVGKSESAVVSSGKGFGEFMKRLAGPVGEYKDFVLEISNGF
tara:strand:- start:641 stop:1156 length:516 start_codon:yes stop_codon:yes gene_type:complete